MATENILPCPFCGKECQIEEMESGSVQNGTRKAVSCPTEDCYGYLPMTSFETRGEAIQVWNQRNGVDLAHFLTVAGADIVDGELVFSTAGYGAFTKRKGTLMAKRILAEHGELIDIAHHFRHCRDCGEGSSCFEGDAYFERLQAISTVEENAIHRPLNLQEEAANA